MSLWGNDRTGARFEHNRDAFHRDQGRWEHARGRWDRDLDNCFHHRRFNNFDCCFIGWCGPWWASSWWWGGWGYPYYVCPTAYYSDIAYYSTPYDYAVVSPANNYSYGGYATYPSEEAVAKPAADLQTISAAFRDGDIVGAEAQLSVALTAHRYDAQLSYIYAYVLAFDGKSRSAAMMLRRAVVLDGEMLKMGNVILDGFYQADQAMAVLQQASEFVAGHPNDTDALLTRAYLRILVGQKDGARDDLQQVLNLNREDLEAAHLLRMVAGGTDSDQ